MRRALLYYMAQTWAADLHRQAPRHKPGRTASQARHQRPSPHAHRVRRLPVLVARACSPRWAAAADDRQTTT
jgi:hypothetical protein